VPSDELQLRNSSSSNIDPPETHVVTSEASSSTELAHTGTGSLPLIEDDHDLVPLLRQASNKELEPLVKYIVENGGVTAQIHRIRAFGQYSPTGNHRMYADDIAAEIQKFGANTFW
jgi:hypothetical protein